MITLNGLTGITAPDFEPSSSTLPTNGMFLPTTNTLAWSTNSTEKLRLDSSGNLGLGVTPSAWGSGRKILQMTNGAAFGDYSGYTGLSQNYYQNGSSDVYIANGYAERYLQGNGQHLWYTAANNSSGAGAALSFTQAMTLDASGNLLVGTTSASAKLVVYQSSSGVALDVSAATTTAATAVGVFTKALNSTATSNALVQFNINGGAAGSGQINANGANAAAFGTYSDSRLKENITELSNQLANICSLKPSEFDYKDGSGHQIGFIAQEMQEVYPDAIGEGEDGMLTITGWSKTEARLVKAIQELSAELNELKQKVNA